MKGSQELIQCNQCFSFQHVQCMGKNSNLNVYQCPTCLLFKLDPMMPASSESTIFGPCIVPTMNENFNGFINKKINEKSFELTEEQLNSEKLYVRCIRLDGKSIGHNWPDRKSVV